MMPGFCLSILTDHQTLVYPPGFAPTVSNVIRILSKQELNYTCAVNKALRNPQALSGYEVNVLVIY